MLILPGFNLNVKGLVLQGYNFFSGGSDVISLAERFLLLNGGTPTYQHPSEEVVSEADGLIDTGHSWVAQSGTPVFASNQIQFTDSGSNQLARLASLNASLVAGTNYRVEFRVAGAGRARIKFGSENTSGYLGEGWYGFDYTPASTQTRIDVQNQGGQGDVNVSNICVRAMDYTTIEYEIWGHWGQSNWAGGATVPPDYTLDVPHPDIDYVAGVTQAAAGTVEGDIHTAIPTIQSRVVTAGVSPMMAEARYYADNHMPAGKRLLLIAAPQGGTSLTSGSGGWNPSGSSPTLYTWLRDEMLAAKALNAANTYLRVSGSQGESDRAADSTPWATKFAEFVSTLRTDLSEPALPFTLVGLNPDALDLPVNTAEMIDKQERCDENSGDALAITGVTYSGWQTAWGDGTKPNPDNTADTVHFGAEANRVRGVQAAIDAFGVGALALITASTLITPTTIISGAA